MRKLFVGILMLLVASVSQADIPKDVVDAANDNVYRVLVTSGSGSAYYVGDNKLVSACHVIVDDESVILVNFEFEHIFTADVLSCNKETDIAVLQLKSDPNIEKMFSHQPPPFATRDPEIGQSVYGGGWPMGIGLIYVEGHWQDLLGGKDGSQAIVTVPAMFGDSGSPAFVIEDGVVKYLGTRNGIFTYPIHGDVSNRNADTGFVHITYIQSIQSTIEELDKLK